MEATTRIIAIEVLLKCERDGTVVGRTAPVGFGNEARVDVYFHS
jgi:hypothetical protein